jgi:hypothetical protein
MVALRGAEIIAVSLDEVTQANRALDPDLYALSRLFS